MSREKPTALITLVDAVMLLSEPEQRLFAEMLAAAQRERRAARRIIDDPMAGKWWPKEPANIPNPDTKPELQLSGENGNAILIIGKAEKAARGAGWEPKQIETLNWLATSGDYDNVLRVCMEYFDVS